MRWAAVGWGARGLELHLDGVMTPLADVVAAEDRYWVRLDGAVSDRLLLVGEGLTLWRNGTPERVPCAPGVHPRDHRLRGPRLLALGSDALYRWTPEGWERHPLPTEIAIRDADFDEEGALWVAGSVPSDRLPGCDTEAALRVQAPGTNRWASRSPRLGPIDAVRTVAQGGLAEVRTVDAAAHPVLATSLCAWFVEDESSFLYALGGRKDRVVRLQEDLVRAVDRPAAGVARAWTVHGEVWTIEGRKITRRAFGRQLLAALGLESRHLVVRAVAARGPEVLVAVEIAAQGRWSEADTGEFSALCVSGDGGLSFRKLRQDRMVSGPDWCGVAL